MIYLIIITYLLFLVISFDIFKQKNGNTFFYILSWLIFVLIAGLRYRIGLDTMIYMDNYQHLPHFTELTTFDFSSAGYDILWILFCAFCKIFSSNFVFMQFIHALIINSIYFYFIKKHTEYKFTAIFLYFIFGFLYFNTEIMRESLAVAVFLFAINAFYDKKWLKYYMISVISIMAHSSAIIVLLFPLLSKVKLNKVFIITFIIAIFISSFLWFYTENIVQMFYFISSVENKATAYVNDDHISNFNETVFNILVYLITPLICLIFSKYYKIQGTDKQVPFMWLYCVLGLFTTYNYVIFTRFQNYLFFPLILCITEIFTQKRENRQIFMKKFFIVLFSLWLTTPRIYLYMKNDGILNSHFYQRYIPYNSVLQKEISQEREDIYRNKY